MPATACRPTTAGPKVHKVGCAGRIVSFNETEDGRLLLALSGVCRFDIVRELEPAHGGLPPRLVGVLTLSRRSRSCDEPVELDRERLMAALAAFFRSRNLSTDWDAGEAGGRRQSRDLAVDGTALRSGRKAGAA